MPDPAPLDQLLPRAGVRLANSTELFPALHQPGEAGLPLLVVDNGLGHAVIALQGAHVLSFHSAGHKELLWISPRCVLEAGKPIRGGIPLCLPWFGPGPDGKTVHGFARTLAWTLANAERLDSGATRLVLTLEGEAAVCALWPYAFAFHLEVIVGEKLHLSFEAQHRGHGEAPFAFAFHTYFAVPQVARARVTGLEGLTFIDKLDQFARKRQVGEVRIEGATDRIYLDAPRTQVLISGTEDGAADRIQIESEAACAVVWNAWTNDRNIPDLGEGNHAGYLCVERGDVADRARSLGTYRAWMTLSR
jgi:glucose-6-phosphate 1-epimerase